MAFNIFGQGGDTPVAAVAKAAGEERSPDAQYEDMLRAALAARLKGGPDFLAADNDVPALWPRTVTGHPVSGRHGLGLLLTAPDHAVFGRQADLAALNVPTRKSPDGAIARYGAKHRAIETDGSGNPIIGDSGPQMVDREYDDPVTVLTPMYGVAAGDLRRPEHYPSSLMPGEFALNAAVGALNGMALNCLAHYAGRSIDAVIAATQGGRLIRVAQDAEPHRLYVMAAAETWSAACLAVAQWLLPKSYNWHFRVGLERGKGEPTGWYKTAALPAPHRHAFEARLLAYALGVLSAGMAPGLGKPDDAYAAFCSHAVGGGNVGRLSVSCRKVGDALYLFNRDIARSPWACGINTYTGLAETDQANAEAAEDIGALIDEASGDKPLPF